MSDAIDTSPQYWQDALDGNAGAHKLKDGDIRYGFYRTAKDQPVAIWFRGDIAMMKIGDGKSTTDVNIIADTFRKVSHRPVTYEDYKAAADTGAWPGRVLAIDGSKATPEPAKEAAPAEASIGHNQPPDGYEMLADEIELWHRELDKELEEGPVVYPDHDRAKRIDEIKGKFLETQKKGEKLKAAERAPYDEEIKKILKRFQPLILRADNGKTKAISAFQNYADGKRKAEEEARRKALEAERAARKAAEQKGIDPDQVAVAKPKVADDAPKMTTHARTKKTVVVVDAKPAIQHVIDNFNPVPPFFVEALLKFGDPLLKNGVAIPGLELKTETYYV